VEDTVNVNEEKGLLHDIKASIIDEVKAELKSEFAKPRFAAQPKENDWDQTEWLKCVFDSNRKGVSPERKEKALNLLTNKYNQFDYHKKAMVQGTDAAGGFLVPEIWSPKLYGLDGYRSLLDLFEPIPMTSDVLKIPVVDQTTTPSGHSAFYGGYKFVVTAEGETETETKPAFKQVALTAVKFMAYTELSNELISNSMVTVQNLISKGAYEAASNEILHQIVNGTDFTATLGNSSVIKVFRTTILRANRIEDYVKLKARVPGAKFWLIGPLVEQDLLSMVNSGGYPTYLISGASAAGPGTICGLPYFTTEVQPALGSEGDVMLVNPSGYALGINQNVTISTSDHYAFGKDAQAVRVTFRAFGAPLLTAPVKLRGATSTTVSWCAVLDDPIS